MQDFYKKYAPSYLQKMPSKKVAMDLAIFSVTVFAIYKFGQQVNATLENWVPTEAAIRQQAAMEQARMQAEQQAQMAAMQAQGGPMGGMGGFR
jgi:malate synthase